MNYIAHVIDTYNHRRNKNPRTVRTVAEVIALCIDHNYLDPEETLGRLASSDMPSHIQYVAVEMLRRQLSNATLSL